MSNYPPYPQNPGYPQQQPMGYGQMPAPRSTSGSAVASFICGLLGCIPFVTSIAAVVLGLIGFAATSKPNVGGRVFAILGILLGLLGIAGWGVGTYFAVSLGGQVMAIAADTQALANNSDFTTLAKYSDVPIARLQELTAKAKARGGIKAVNIDNQQGGANSDPSKNGGVVDGTFTLGDGTKAPFKFRLDFTGGKFRIVDFDVNFNAAKQVELNNEN